MASVKRPLKLGFLQRDQIRMRQDHGIGQMTPCQDQQKESWPLGGIRPEWETEHESEGDNATLRAKTAKAVLGRQYVLILFFPILTRPL